MADPLTILIVDQQADAVLKLRRSLNRFGTLEVIGDVGFGPVASTWAHDLEPAVVIVAVDEPLRRSLMTIEALALGNPQRTVVGLVNQFDPEVFRLTVLAGARDVLVRSSPTSAMHDQIVQAHNADRLRGVEGRHFAASTGSIITVFGVKGGIGKTMLATNLAVALAQEGSASVALVDLDLPSGDVALMLDLYPEHDILETQGSGVIDDLEHLQRLLVRSPYGVHVLSSPLVPDESRSLDSSTVGPMLSKLAALYQFVVVDTPVGLTELTTAALDAASSGLMVTTPEIAALHRTHVRLAQLRRVGFATSKLRLVLNRVESRTRVSTSEAAHMLGYPHAWTVANDYAAMRSSAIGSPVVLSQPKSPVSRDIREIARLLTGAPIATRKGWLAWLRRALLMS